MYPPEMKLLGSGGFKLLGKIRILSNRQPCSQGAVAVTSSAYDAKLEVHRPPSAPSKRTSTQPEANLKTHSSTELRFRPCNLPEAGLGLEAWLSELRLFKLAFGKS